MPFPFDFQDARFALRSFARTPALSLVAILTLALGIGPNTALFSIMDAVLLRPLSFPDSDRIVLVRHVHPEEPPVGALSLPDYLDFRDQATSMGDLAAWHEDTLTLTGRGQPQRLAAVASTWNIFRLLQVSPALGRTFAVGEDQAGRNQVAVISYAAWKRIFGGDAAVLDHTVTLDGLPFTIVGVLPESFRYWSLSSSIDIYVPIPRALDSEYANERNAHYLGVIGRLGPGVSRARAQADLALVASRLAAAHPAEDARRSAVVSPLQEELVKDLRPAIILLFGAVVLVLLIACANVTNILLARASVRQRELLIRVALGANRGRIIRQMLVETALLALIGGGLGILLALWGLDALRVFLPPEIKDIHPIAVNPRVLLFTFSLSLTVGLVFGSLPALLAADQDPANALKDDARTSTHGRGHLLLRVLVVAEIALAMLLLVGSGLTLKSLHILAQVDPGFDPKNLVVTALSLPASRYRDSAQVAGFYQALKQNLARIPGVEGLAIGLPMPYSSAHLLLGFTISGEPPAAQGQENAAALHAVNPGYFRTLSIPIVRGREFMESEDALNSRPVAVVNQAFARRFFPGRDPLGQQIAVEFHELKAPLEIVGVAGDTRGNGLDQDPAPEVFAPFGATLASHLEVAVRARATEGLADAVRSRISAIDPQQPFRGLRTMDDAIGESMAKQRLMTLLLGIFGGVALALALVGVYGVMSYTVTQRVHEVAIRMALGARPIDVLSLIMRRGLLLTLLGIGGGALASLAFGRILSIVLFGVTTSDPTILGAAMALLFMIATLANWLPARRATRVDPMISLRRP